MNARLVVTPKGGVDFLFQVCVMVKTFAAFIVLVLLPACAAAPDWFPSALRDPGAGRHQHALAEFSFEWELSGSREVAPLQIFDDGQRTWLQFASQQPVPAIFELAAGGARPLFYPREGPYIVQIGRASCRERVCQYV